MASGCTWNRANAAPADGSARFENTAGGERSEAALRVIERALTARGGALGLLVIILLSLAFRLHVAAECSLWVDEAITRRGVLEPLSEILRGPSETHPPLMYWLVAPIVAVFGDSELALRSVSLFFGCVLLAAVYELCRELGLSIGRSLLVVATLALAPFFIRHATEARHYAMVAAFVTLAVTRALRALRPDAKLGDFVGFAGAAVAAAATHYFALAYAFALLAMLVLGVALGGKQARRRWPALLGVLLAMLAVLGYLTRRALELGRSYGAGADRAVGDERFDHDLLVETLRAFSFLTGSTWSLVLQPALALGGLLLLSLQLRGVARLLPFGIGAAPCVAAPLITADHFIAPRYIIPSFVFCHLALCVVLLAGFDWCRGKLESARPTTKLAPLLGALAVACGIGARLQEFPEGYGAGGDDYRSLQRYFIDNLARDTRLVAYNGGFGRLLMSQYYSIGSHPLALEGFRPLRKIRRYLVIEIHVDGPERRAAFERLIVKRLRLSVEEWRKLPLVALPHSIYQTPVAARLVELPQGRWPKRRPRKRR